MLPLSRVSGQAWQSRTAHVAPGPVNRRAAAAGLQLPQHWLRTQQASTMLSRRSCIAMFRRAPYPGSQASPPLAECHYGHPSTGVSYLVHSAWASVRTSRLSSPIRSMHSSGFNSSSRKSSSCSSRSEIEKMSIKRNGFPPQQQHQHPPLRLSSPSLALSLNHKPSSSLTSTRSLAVLHTPLPTHKHHSLDKSSEQNTAAMMPTVNRTSLHPSGVL